MDLNMGLKGLNTLKKSLDVLKKNNTKALKKGVAAGIKHGIKKMKQNCPVSADGNFKHPPGNLRRSIAGKVLKQKYPDSLMGIMGPRTGKNQKYDGWYGRLVEYGHTAPNGTKVDPQPFMRQTEAEIKDEVQRVMAQAYKQALIDNKSATISEVADTIIGDIEG